MKLKYVSWADTTGYAIAAKSYLRALDRAGVAVKWEPMIAAEAGYVVDPAHQSDDPALARLIGNDVDYDTVLIHTVPEYYPAWIESEKAKGKRVFGYTVWELETLPDHWPDILNRLDGVIVPCSWNAEVFARSGVTVPIHVVPHLSQFHDSPASLEGTALAQWSEALSPERFVFYTIGYWSNRKAPDLVLKAVLRAFGADDPVSLVIKTSRNDITRRHRHWRNGFRSRHPSPRQTARRIMKDMPSPPVAVIADETLTDSDMLALHRRGDCFVSLARTEGWGLGAFDAALAGNPVIMTGYGGQRDFLDAGRAHLVDYQMVPVHEPTWSANYRPEDRWAEPSLDQAVDLMRNVYRNRREARERAESLARDIRTRFSEKAVVSALIGSLA